MDARQLRYFLAVVDAQGVGRAAEQLFIAQPSLSQAIAGLERELGVALFHRVGRGVVLSDAGRQLVGPARQVLRDLATAQATIDAIKGVGSGRVEIVAMPSPGIEPLATLIQPSCRWCWPAWATRSCPPAGRNWPAGWVPVSCRSTRSRCCGSRWSAGARS
jgi:DNA-binding transcriptional LysR family regulator